MTSYFIITSLVGVFTYYKFLREDGGSYIGLSAFMGMVWPLSIFIFIFLEVDYWIENKSGGSL